MDFIECASCLAEFRVISDTDEPVQYCPYCGSTVELDSEEDEDGDED